jgi:hypothetical protein
MAARTLHGYWVAFECQRREVRKGLQHLHLVHVGHVVSLQDMHVYMYECMQIHLQVQVFVYAYIHVRVHARVYVYVYVHVNGVYVCIYACILSQVS